LDSRIFFIALYSAFNVAISSALNRTGRDKRELIPLSRSCKKSCSASSVKVRFALTGSVALFAFSGVGRKLAR